MAFPRMWSRVGAADWCLCWWCCPLCFTRKCGHPVNVSKLPSEGHHCQESKSRSVERRTNTMSGQDTRATHGALGNFYFLHSRGCFQVLSENPVLEQTYWASALGRAGLMAGSAIYYEATLGKLLTFPHFVSLYVKREGILCCWRIICTCKPWPPDLTHSEPCYGSYCSCMWLKLNPLPLISNKL